MKVISGLVIVAALATLGQLAVRPLFETGFGLAVTHRVPGDARHFDPIAYFAGAEKFSGEGARLTGLEARHVASDGTLDLTASYRPTVSYKFVREVPTPADHPPAGKSDAGSWHEPIEVNVSQPNVWRSVTSRGGKGVFGNVQYSYLQRGIEREVRNPVSVKSVAPALPAPSCSFADLWRSAIAQANAPAGAVADIRYDADGYEFEIRDAKVHVLFDASCTVRPRAAKPAPGHARKHHPR